MDLVQRLKLARKESGLTQRQVCDFTGIDDSSLSAFENGRQEPRLGILEKLANAYHLPLSFFFSDNSVSKQVVMWRNQPENKHRIQGDFLNLCRQYHQLEVWTSEIRGKLLPDLDNYGDRFGYREAAELAYDARREMGLGERPGEILNVVLGETYGVKIFCMNLGSIGTAACACAETFGEAVLLNKTCSRWRRNHDLAHELFHLLTWPRFEHNTGTCEPTPQEEKLATCFAANLLLPEEPVRYSIERRLDDEGQINLYKLDGIAREFDVSLESLMWRMHYLYNWEETNTRTLIDQAKAYVKDAPREKGPKPPELPERYRALAIRALCTGEISLGRFAQFMKISRQEAANYLDGMESENVQVSASAS